MMRHEQTISVAGVVDQPDSDAALVMAARGGDQSGFGRLVERHFGMVWAIAYARLRQRDAADELAQEVFLLAQVHLDELADAKRFAGWLSQIVHHRAVDWLRRKQVSSRLVRMVPLENLSAHPAMDEGTAMEQEEEHQAVREVLFALPDEQREVVLLHFAEGLSHKEIADRLEVHPGTVGRQLQKALARMRKTLESVLRESVRPMRGSQAVVARTVMLTATAGGMSNAAKGALVAAGGAVPKLAAVTWIGMAGKTAMGLWDMGAGIATATKVIVGIAVLVAANAVGIAVYSGVPAATPSPATAQATSAPPTQPDQTVVTAAQRTPDVIPPATADELQKVLAAAKECFPMEVITYLMKASEDAGRQLDETLPIFPQASGIDHNGTRWIGVMEDGGTGAGDGTLDLYNTSNTSLAGVVTLDQQVLPVTRTRNTRNTGSAWESYRMTADLGRPPNAGELFGVLMRSGNLLADKDGLYPLRLGNTPGPACIQQLILVLPPMWQVKSSSEAEVSTQKIGTTTVHLWQKRLPAHGSFIVRVVLEKRQ